MTLYTATSAVVAVPAGAPAGNRVIRFISRGGILPEDADQQTVDHLLELGMISVLPELEVADEPEATMDLESMTVEQLREYAQEHEIDLQNATKKADLLLAILAATA